MVTFVYLGQNRDLSSLLLSGCRCSAWFCPRDVNVQIYDDMEKGVSLKIASMLPSPLSGEKPFHNHKFSDNILFQTRAVLNRVSKVIFLCFGFAVY